MRAWISKFVFKIIDRCVIIIKIKCDYAALRRLLYARANMEVPYGKTR